MRCPSCSSPAHETDTACGQCGFTLEMTDQVFGIPPMMTPPVVDLAQVLTNREHGAIRAAVLSLEQRFPQVSASVVLASAPPAAPLPVYAFWLFNRAALFSAVEKAGENRGLLLLIDVTRGEALLMPGYGLEPFVPEAALQHCLDTAGTALARASFAEAALTCISELEREFTAICQTLPKAFGLHDEAVWFANPVEPGVALTPSDSRDDLF